MGVTRRLFLGGFTAGAVTVAAGGDAVAAEAGGDAVAAEAAGETTVFDGPVVAPRFSTDSTVNSGFFRTTSTTEHAVTVHQAATSGKGVALNIVSDNPDDSTVYVKGHERAQRGTVKITHVGAADGSDAGASAVSIDLTVAGTAAQGIFLNAANGPTQGNLICLRNNGRDDFVVKGSGRVGIGMDIGANPWSQLHVVQRPGTPSALMVEGLVRVTDVAAAPTGVDSRGGGVLYAENGALMWRGPHTVTRIAPA
ncbi:hyaluronoglucosaminidase [Streptomyces rubrolavendulae]|uniref:Hyaluronidase protein (HylP) n=1 Tax=Streptomyces rubrolavendulae TaxID=285473 RepID=A0A1D8G892_9ACTN|nr:hyaluronoglucosaminidase [Streptomyces rubrolavendulae]AOT61680.1 Hyaluronidase protein (HylP) [Streptomyces rubrolavendulae]